jgi:hypothetical protein
MPTPTTSVLAVAIAAMAAMVAVPGAIAKDRDVRISGKCTTAATSKLKLSGEDGGIEVEFEVDQNRNGIPWRVTLRRNGSLVGSTTARTRAPSGSFSVRRVITNKPGVADRVVAVAKSPTGATCTATGSF